MFTPLPLRLCCMAAMAPALTEAASQARVKLSSNAQGTPDPTLVNGRDCPGPQPVANDRALTRSPVQSLVGRPQLAALVTQKELLQAKRRDGSGIPNPTLTHLGTIKNLSHIYKQDRFTAVTRATQNGGLVVTDSKSCVSHPSKPNISCKLTMMNGGNNGQSPVTGNKLVMGHSTNTQDKPINTALHSLANVDTNNTSSIPKSGQISSNSTQLQQVVKNPTLKSMGSTKAAISSMGSSVDSRRKTTAGDTVIDKNEKISPDEANVPVKAPIDLVADATKRQQELERRAQRLLRRVRRLQTRQANVHVQKQLNGFVDYQHKNLQSMAKSMKAPISSTDLKTELLQKEDVKSLSTAALVNLVRKLQSSQTITLRQRLASSNVNGSGDDNSVLTLDKDLCSELSRVSGQLRTNLHHLETAFDSDATESSSGGESCDEEEYDFDIDGRYPSMPLHRRAEWKWAVDRAAVAARWTWLQAQVSDLEYRIRQQSEIYRQIRQAKSGVVLSEQSASQDLMSKVRPSRTGKKLSPIEAKIANLEKRNELSPCSLSTLLSNVDKQATAAVQSGSGSSVTPSVNGPTTATNKGRLQAPPKPPNGYIDPNGPRGNHTATSEDTDIEILDPLNKKARTGSTVGTSGSSEAVLMLDTSCMAARCRPLRSYRKRKLLRTWGLHQVSRKAARLSTVKCHCFPPSTPCAMCGGRFNNTQTVDAEVSPLPERVSLIDTSFHPVLSFPQDIPLPVHFEALLKSGDWQNKPPPKPIRTLQSEKRRMKLSSAAVSEHIRKHTKKLPKSVAASLLSSARIRNKYESKQLSRSASLPTTPKNMGSVATTRLLKSDVKLHKRKAALHALAMKRQRSMSLPSPAHKQTCLPSPTERDTPSPLAGSCPSSTFKEMREAMKKRRGESAFDINNIVIPYSMAASTRVEKLQYKEIITPKWRMLNEEEEKGNMKEMEKEAVKKEMEKEAVKKEMEKEAVKKEMEKEAVKKEMEKEAVKKPDGDEGLVIRIKKEEGEETEEDISDDSFTVRHLRCEINEKKRFISYITQQKRGRSMRTDSECCTPDPMSPETSLGGDTMFTTLQSLPPTPATPTTPLPTSASASRLTTLSEEHEETLKRVSSTPLLKEDVQIRRRSGSLSKVQRARTMSTEDGGRSQAGTPAPPDVMEDRCAVAPWEQRTFPLDDADYDMLFQETPLPEPSTSNIPRTTMITTPGSLKSGFSEAGSPEASNPCSPLPSSSASSVAEDDPNDPEWTVVSPEKQLAIPKTGIVLKLAKR